MWKIFLFLFVSCNVFSSEVMQKPSLHVVKKINPSCYESLIKELDNKMSLYGLEKLNAPALDKISRKDVVFYVYADANKKIRPLVISDLKKRGYFEIQIYKEDFETEKKYIEFKNSVINIFDNYEDFSK